MANLAQKLLGMNIGLAAIMGCDSRQDVVLTSGQIENVEVKYIRNKEVGFDSASLEIYDSRGHLRAHLDLPGSVNYNGFIQYDDKKVTIEGFDIIEPTSK